MRSIVPWTEPEMVAVADELDDVRDRVHQLERRIGDHSRLAASEVRAMARAERSLQAVRSTLEDVARRSGFVAAVAPLSSSARRVPLR